MFCSSAVHHRTHAMHVRLKLHCDKACSELLQDDAWLRGSIVAAGVGEGSSSEGGWNATCQRHAGCCGPLAEGELRTLSEASMGAQMPGAAA